VHLVEELAKTLVTTPEKPKFTSTDGKGGSDRGYAKVRLGVQPSMSKREGPGLGIDDVSAGTSAADAGLTKGDVILKWGDKPMEGAADLMERLRDHEPGDVVKLTILRDGKEMIVDVTLKASKK
jgi:S1-C subfamily serine protease